MLPWAIPLAALILSGCGLSASPSHTSSANAKTAPSPSSPTQVVQATPVTPTQAYQVPPGTYQIGVTVGTRNAKSGLHGLHYRLIDVVVGKHGATFNGSVINTTGQTLSIVMGMYGGDAYYLTSQQEQVDPLQSNNQSETSNSFGYTSGDIQPPSNWTPGAALLGWTKFPVPTTSTITFRQPPFKSITIRFGR